MHLKDDPKRNFPYLGGQVYSLWTSRVVSRVYLPYRECLGWSLHVHVQDVSLRTSKCVPVHGPNEVWTHVDRVVDRVMRPCLGFAPKGWFHGEPSPWFVVSCVITTHSTSAAVAFFVPIGSDQTTTSDVEACRGV